MATQIGGDILGTAGTAISIINQIYGAQTQSAQLKTQAAQETIAAQQRMGQRLGALETVLGQQQASAAGRGLDLASTSVKALTKDSFDKYDADKAAEAMSEQFRQAQLRVNLAQVRNREYAGIFKTAAEFTMAKLDQGDMMAKKAGAAYASGGASLAAEGAGKAGAGGGRQL